MTPALLAPYGMTAGAGLEARDRGGADDRAGLLLDHVRHRMLDREERPDQVDAQHFLPVLDGLLGQRHQPAADAGIGPDRIEPAVFRHRLVDEGLHVGFRTGIRHHGLDGAAGIADELCGFLHALGAVDDDQLRAFPGEQHRRCAPDAAASTCDDDGFAFEAAHEFLPDSYARQASAALRNSNKISNVQSHLRRCVL